jgi:hypothetical protein
MKLFVQFPVIINSSADFILQFQLVLAHNNPVLASNLTKLICETEEKA